MSPYIYYLGCQIYWNLNQTLQNNTCNVLYIYIYIYSLIYCVDFCNKCLFFPQGCILDNEWMNVYFCALRAISNAAFILCLCILTCPWNSYITTKSIK